MIVFQSVFLYLCIKIIFFLKKLFLRLIHQNNSKYKKKLILNKKLNLKFLKTGLDPRFHMLSKQFAPQLPLNTARDLSLNHHMAI